jgi:hypothetical protein
MKFALPRNAFVQFTGVFDVIFKFIVPLLQLRGHHVNSRRRIVRQKFLNLVGASSV